MLPRISVQVPSKFGWLLPQSDLWGNTLIDIARDSQRCISYIILNFKINYHNV